MAGVSVRRHGTGNPEPRVRRGTGNPEPRETSTDSRAGTVEQEELNQ